eukprot:1011752-Amphidinium_carterae.1
MDRHSRLREGCERVHTDTAATTETHLCSNMKSIIAPLRTGQSKCLRTISGFHGNAGNERCIHAARMDCCKTSVKHSAVQDSLKFSLGWGLFLCSSSEACSPHTLRHARFYSGRSTSNTRAPCN